jgi:hypothetical protein
LQNKTKILALVWVVRLSIKNKKNKIIKIKPWDFIVDNARAYISVTSCYVHTNKTKILPFVWVVRLSIKKIKIKIKPLGF